MIVMFDYVLIIIILCLGILSVEVEGGIQFYVVIGGFVEINVEGMFVLVE